MSKQKRKHSISRAQARAFARRWRLTNDAIRAERRATPPEERLRQLAVMMQAARQMGWTDALAAEEKIARERWQQLRKAWRGRK